ncbi:MAG: deoxycytidine deaminase [Halorubrum sp. J07HR59]|nr:MAG: deoxycytidine deaminase [Halorubrum sp. J07HR59]
MFRSGSFVAETLDGVDGGAVAAEQVQPNGVDLTLGAVFQPSEPGRIDSDSTYVADRKEISPDGGIYRLDPGRYVVRYGDPVRIPTDHVGFIYPRSSLLRNGCTLDTAVWDAGYEGVGEGLLEVGHRIEIESGARICQLVLANADHDQTYDGSYQEEHL